MYQDSTNQMSKGHITVTSHPVETLIKKMSQLARYEAGHFPKQSIKVHRQSL